MAYDIFTLALLVCHLFLKVTDPMSDRSKMDIRRNAMIVSQDAEKGLHHEWTQEYIQRNRIWNHVVDFLIGAFIFVVLMTIVGVILLVLNK